MASDSLAKFSDLLRYQLYECNEPKIPLLREIDYLTNFIELGRLRLDEEVQVKVNISKMDNSHFEIAPFILMPFFENAFKHVSQMKGNKNWLQIDIHQTNKGIEMEVTNSTLPVESTSKQKIMENSGIGLTNVVRRLDLLYPDLYELEVFQKDGAYTVSLQLQLSSPEENIIMKELPTTILQQ